MSKFRIERHGLGEIKVLSHALYAAQTQRTIENFPISNLALPIPFLKALTL